MRESKENENHEENENCNSSFLSNAYHQIKFQENLMTGFCEVFVTFAFSGRPILQKSKQSLLLIL